MSLLWEVPLGIVLWFLSVYMAVGFVCGLSLLIWAIWDTMPTKVNKKGVIEITLLIASHIIVGWFILLFAPGIYDTLNDRIGLPLDEAWHEFTHPANPG